MNVHALQHELFGYALTVFPLLKNFFNIKMPIAMYFIIETKKRKIVRKSLSRIMSLVNFPKHNTHNYPVVKKRGTKSDKKID